MTQSSDPPAVSATKPSARPPVDPRSQRSLRAEGSPGSEAGPPAQAAPRARVVLDAAGVSRATKRIAHEIRERYDDLAPVLLVAIASGGVPVAQMIAEQLHEIAGVSADFAELDVTLYRDDVIGRGLRPIPHPTRMPAQVVGRRVVLIDDVVYTGRTIRAAMDAVMDFGRPESIQVACLVDRGHRELPIQVDFVGKNIPTARAEQVELVRRDPGYEVEVR